MLRSLFKRPKTFEAGFLIVLIALWLANAATEKTSLGRILLGYKSELFPMSTFSVYLSPKLQKTSVFYFEIIPNKGDEPIRIGAYDMFYPLAAPNLDDEIATNQLMNLVEAYHSHCSAYQQRNFKYCKRDPAPKFILQQDIAEMFLRSIAWNTGTQKTPYAIRFNQKSLWFNPENLDWITRVSEKTLMAFYPQESWVAHAR